VHADIPGTHRGAAASTAVFQGALIKELADADEIVCSNIFF
jgi:hypothetical protein